MGFKPKQVLFALKIRQFKETSATRLRRALDRPDARRERGEKHIPPYHYAIYDWQKNRSQNLYNRIIKPAEYEEGEKTFLRPDRLRVLIEAEKKEARICSSPVVPPGSDEESLAFFALAFALLQKGEAYDILEPLLLAGACFREFFGATEIGEDSKCQPEIALVEKQPGSFAGKLGTERIREHEEESVGEVVSARSTPPTGPQIENVGGPRTAEMRMVETRYE